MLRNWKSQHKVGYEHSITSGCQSSGVDLINILQTKWACPPRFRVDPNWKMEAGSESQETHIQIQRESTTPQTIYLHNSNIPPNPSVAQDALGSNRDDISIPVIPLTVVNDETTPIKAKETTTHPLLQRDEVINTAVTLVSLIKSKDPENQIDLELLIQLLQNPGMLQQLMKEHGLSTNQDTPPVTVTPPRTRIPFGHYNMIDQIHRNVDVGKVRKLINEYGDDCVKPRKFSSSCDGIKDTYYYRRLVSEHGVAQERGVCVYFNSPQGCRRGSS